MFKMGDICVIVDIGRNSSHHPHKHLFIGKRVKFAEYTHPVVICNGFIQCEMYAQEEIRLPSRVIFKGQRFLMCSVKLQKIGSSGGNVIYM